MIHAATIAIRKYLETHPNFGVTPMLECIDVLEDDPRPQPIDIYDDFTTDPRGYIKGDLTPPTTPALIVFTDNDGTIDVSQTQRGGRLSGGLIADRVPVFIGFVNDQAGDTAQGQRLGAYYLDAARQSVLKLASEKSDSHWRRALGFTLLEMKQMSESRVREGVGAAFLYGYLVTYWRIVLDIRAGRP